MSDEHRFERDARAWLELGPTDAPDRVVEAALVEIDKTSQERVLWIPWRLPTMTPRLGLAATALVAVAAVGLIYLNLPGRGSVSSPSPTPTVSPAASSSTRPQPTVVDYSSIPGWVVFEHFGKAPDGTTPAGTDYPNSIWLIHADGSDLHELSPGVPASGKIAPDISPDGSHVIFSAYDSPVQVWEVGIEGGDPELVSTDCSGIPADCMDADPAYSPDGKRIAFLRATETSSVLAIRDLASGAVTTLPSTLSSVSNVWLAQPSWSPDGEQIVYHKVVFDEANDKVADSRIFVVNADGTGLHELPLPDDDPYGDADWSPDGSRLVFGRCPIHEFNGACANTDVYTARPDGSDLQLLTRPGVGYGAPSWTDDGQIMFWGPTTFYLMDADGQSAHRINESGALSMFGSVLGYGYYGLLQPTP
jgi:Tol biopolymer transport system component